MSQQERRERTLARHAGDQAAADTLDVGHLSFRYHIIRYFQRVESLIEGIQEKEPNTVEIKVTKSMTKQDVVDKILQEIEAMN